MRHLFQIGLGIALCAEPFSPASRAEIKFEQVQEQAGLNLSVLYGPTFDFSGDPPATQAMKQVMQRNMGNGAAVGDYDNDGDLDMYLLRQTNSANRLYRNDVYGEANTFVNVTAQAGVGNTGFSRAAQFADLDNDGWDDLILINDDVQGGPYAPSAIYRNRGDGTFTDVTAGSGFAPSGLIKGGMCLGDYDGDGLVDLYVTLWLMELGEGTPGFAGSNRLYRNLGNFQFQDVTVSSGVGLLSRDSFACVFADFDSDSDVDLYVAIDHTSDAYYRNNGNGTFTDRTLAVGATHTGNDMGISVFDFDDDGDLDVYSTNITDPSGIFGTTQFNTLLVNQLEETGFMAFVNEAGARGVRDTYWGWGTEFFDADNDSDLDLYAVNGFDEFAAALGAPLVDTPEVLFVNDGAGDFERSTGTGADFVGDARAAIAFDHNLDGLLDMLVTNIVDPVVLLENRTEDPGNWVSVELIGLCGDNTNAIGGRIRLTTEETAQMRDVIAGGSYLSGRPFVQHFGIGSAEQIDQLIATFPDGSDFVRKNPQIVNRRTGILHATDKVPGRLIISRNLRDFAAFQRCMEVSYDSGTECEPLDTDGDQDGFINIHDFDDFLMALFWTLPGCVTP